MDDIISDEDLQDEIALKVLEDDESALQDILNYYAPNIERALFGRYSGLLNSADIEDVMSIAITKFWDNRHNYDDKRGSVRAFLYRIAVNTTKDVLKLGWHKAKLLERSVDQEFLEQSLTIEEQTVESVVDKGESKEVQAMKKVLATLSDIQRKILLADAMANGVADSAELGEQLGGFPSGTIRQYRMRALRALRKGMKEQGFDIPEIQ